MHGKPLLSICIPTYNRAQLLQQAVESILAQVEASMLDELEIIISDNASTDDTRSIAKQLVQEANLLIKYYLNEKNVGAENNFLLSVERTCGQYVWILGDDDLLVVGALKKILEEIKQSDKIDLYFGEKEDFYLTPDRPMRFRPIMRFDSEMIFDFRKQEDIEEYFSVNRRLIAYCNFISNIIFNRERWLEVEDKEKYVGTEYVHVYVFQSMLWGRLPGSMKYIPQPLVRRRWGNNEGTNPIVRVRKDVEMFHRIAAVVFTQKKYVRLIDALVLKNDGFSWAVRVKIYNRWSFYRDIFPLFWRYYWSQPLFWLKIVPLVFLPNILLKFMRGGYRKLVKGESINLKEMLDE